MPNAAETSQKLPLVSIGMPTYNGAKRIGAALNSIWNSKYPSLDVIICDNCSTDETRELCEQVASEHPEVRYIRHEENIGIRRNFECALNNAKGEYFMWVSDDDFIEPDIFVRYVAFLQNNLDYSLVTGKIRYWVGKDISHLEGVSFEQAGPSKRMVEYYLWVRWGGMVHSMMRTKVAQAIPIPDVYGYDWHYVANVAFMGKLKVFDFVGYNKHLGGSSGNWVKMARTMGEPFWVGRFPVVKLALDAFQQLYRSPSFDGMSAFSKFFAATSCGFAVLYKLLPQSWRHNIRKDEKYRSIRPKEEIIHLREQMDQS